MALYIWGSNKEHQLGLALNQKEVHLPKAVELFKEETIVDFSAGDAHALAVNEFGDVFAWGRGNEGQLGLGDERAHDIPRRVQALEGIPISRIACGDSHSVALSSNGEVFMWGMLNGRPAAPQSVQQTSGHNPVALAGLFDSSEASLAAIVRMARDHDSSTTEELSMEFDVENSNRVPVYSPRLCSCLLKYRISNIAAGFAHSLASSECGAVFSCGYNDNGQLGTGNRQNCALFKKIDALSGFFVTNIACGQQHSLACTRIDDVNPSKSGVCFAWGLGILGQLGWGEKSSLVPIEVLLEKAVISVAAGSHHSVVATEDGEVYSWGHSEYGQHGAPESNNDLQHGDHYYYPRLQKTLKDAGVSVAQVACSSLSTFAVTSDGMLYSWGWNAFGVLGNGKYRQYAAPELVRAFQNETVCAAAAGSNHCGVIVAREGCHYSLRYREMLNEGLFNDLKFMLADGHTCSAHRVAIESRCPYLKGVIRAAESCDDGTYCETVLDLFEDVDVQIFRSFLVFLYAGRVEVAPHKRSELARLADRVCLSQLGVLCRGKWHSSTSEVNQLSPAETFVHDMGGALSSKLHADIAFVWCGTDGSPYRVLAHKAILVQTNYFRTMLCGAFAEATAGKPTTQGVQEIRFQEMEDAGLPSDLFEKILFWIYTGSFDNFADLDSSCLMDLFVGANLLNLPVLANMCERKLAAMLQQADTDSVRACLDFATTFNALWLKNVAERILRAP